MGLHTPPLYLQAGSYPASEDRQLMSALVSRGGVVAPTHFQVQQTVTPSMSVLVSSGRAFIPGTTSSNQGMYSAWSDATVTATITAANATNPRIDIVVLTVRDAAVSGANNDVILQVIAGTPSGSPIQPSTPVSSILLATVAVGASVSNITNANITNLSLRAAPSGTEIPVQSQAERDALTLFPGLKVYRLDTLVTETYNGTGWITPSARRFDGVPSTISVSPANTTIPVTAWQTNVYNVGDIAYSSGIFTVSTAGRYRWDTTVLWPGSATSYRVAQFILYNGGARTAGELTFNFASGVGLQALTTGYVEQMSAGDTLQLGLSCSTSGLTGVTPSSISVVRM